MKTEINLFAFLLAFFILQSAWGKVIVYDLTPLNSKTPGIKFYLPFTAGTHEGESNQLLGSITIDTEHWNDSHGEFHVPIDSITTGNKTRDCHLRESLGLNYSDAHYPAEHSCTDQNQLPLSGKRSVIYPEITLKIHSLSKTPSSDLLEINGTWTIHGNSRAVKLPVKMLPHGKEFQIQGEAELSLKDYGVEVKSVHLLFVSISVHDQVRVLFNLLLSPH